MKKKLAALIFCVCFMFTNKVFAQNYTQLDAIYINDVHGELIKYGKFVSFLAEHLNNKKSLVSASGDMYIGKNERRNHAMTQLMNLSNVDIFTLGNHEFDNGSAALARQLKKAKFKTIMTNMDIPNGNPLTDLKNDKLFSSAIIEKDGEKYGIIGAAPIEVNLGLFDKTDAVTVLDSEKTVQALNAEVKKLESQGINKIILISHLGYFGNGGDLNIAQKTEGIDVILGGHTHLLIEGTQHSDKDKTHLKNLVMSKRNEPVIIVQAGGLGEYIGHLKVLFDEKGIIATKNDLAPINDIFTLEEFQNLPKTPYDELINKINTKALGKNEIVATVKTPFVSSGTTEERNTENPTANLLTDAVYDKVKNKNVEVVLLHSPDVRGGLEKQITTYQIKYSMLPFNGDFYYIELSEKDFVKLLNTEAMTSILTDNSQIIQCKGMSYTVDKTIQNPDYDKAICIKDVVIKSNDTNRVIDPANPNPDNTIKCAVAGYMFLDKRTKDILANGKNKQFIGKEQDILIKYLKKQKTVNPVREGRVKVIEKL